MASRQRYTKLNLGPADKVTARNSVVGCVVIADYLDVLNNQRTILVERPLTATGHRASKPKVKKPVDSKPRTDPATAFPAVEAARG